MIECRNCGEEPDAHQESTCPPDFDGTYGRYCPPFAVSDLEEEGWL